MCFWHQLPFQFEQFSLPLDIRKHPKEKPEHKKKLDGIDNNCPPKMRGGHATGRDDRAHTLKHIGGGKQVRNWLKERRQRRHRIEHGRKRLNQDDKTPRKNLRGSAEAKDGGVRKQSQCPPKKKEIEHKGNEREAEREQVETVYKRREHGENDTDKNEPHQTDRKST